jgi:predicted transcriptional regulator
MATRWKESKMPRKKKESHLTRREEQILAILYRRGEASVADLEKMLPGSPTSGAVRRLLNLLHGKGAIEFRQDGAKKIYRAAIKKDEAGTRALQQVVETFFGGSALRTVGALFDGSKTKLSDKEKKALASLIKNAKNKGR